MIAWMLIWCFPQTPHTVGEFMAIESTKHKPGKDSIKGKEKKKFNTFFTIVSAITVPEAADYKNGNCQTLTRIKKKTEK